MHNPYNEEFKTKACEELGGVWRFSGWFGVSNIHKPLPGPKRRCTNDRTCHTQDKSLFVYDPLAMQHILVKDHSNFDEIEEFRL